MEVKPTFYPTFRFSLPSVVSEILEEGVPPALVEVARTHIPTRADHSLLYLSSDIRLNGTLDRVHSIPFQLTHGAIMCLLMNSSGIARPILENTKI